MNWKLDFNAAVEVNRIALVSALAGIISMVAGNAVLPRHLKYQILRLLRPAESAARRLVFVLVERCHSAPTLPPCRGDSGGGKGAKENSGPKQLLSRCGAAPFVGFTDISPVKGESGTHVPAFQLFDPLKRFDVKSRKYTKNPPRIWNFNDPHEVFTPIIQAPEPTADDELSAASIVRRMKALEIALSDLPAQARRLAKIRARRKRPTSRNKRTAIMRPGFPPGYRKRHLYDIDAILDECHSLACYAREWPS